MRVLLTNFSLDQRAGSQLYLRDVAIELARRGHEPAAYSTKLGAVAEELRAAGVPVTNRLDTLAGPPDVIHGQHHYETLTAILRFPETPAIYYCHGAVPWQEAPLRSPRILRYVAVDEPCRERLEVEGGIPRGRIELVWNFFDQRRFPPRAPLPRRPRLALAFGNEFTLRGDLPVLRRACARRGIELHAAGIAAGKPEADPGRRLARYDLVFARARAAIEAMAVGAAVVLCGHGKAGPLVTTTNFASLRALNFGLKALAQPLDADWVAAELDRYNSRDAEEVSRLTRENCELQPVVDRVIQLYSEVVEEFRREPAPAVEEVSRAAARYLEQWAPHYTPALDLGVKLALQEREIEALRSSVTWRWSQRVLGHRLVQGIFGRWIRAAAARSAQRHRR